MFTYHAFGLNISSEIQLPGMVEASGEDKTDVEIVLGSVSISEDILDGPHYLVSEDGVYLWWDDIGRVKISGGKKINVQMEENENQMIPFLLGPVMAIILHQRGYLVLHGSAIKINDGAVAFLGYRGFGKSTTAINFYRKGYPLVTDDILAIDFDDDQPMVYPGYLHARLSSDSYNHVKDSTDILTPIRTIAGKAFCDTSYGFSPEPLTLERIYMLEKGDEIGISSLTSQDNLMDLIRHSTANFYFTENEQAENLLKCGKLIQKVTLKTLKLKHSFKDISELIELVEEDLEN